MGECYCDSDYDIAGLKIIKYRDENGSKLGSKIGRKPVQLFKTGHGKS